MGRADFLCGSSGTAGSNQQYHVFPWSLSVAREGSYYEASREYILNEDNAWTYDYRQTGYDTGNGSFRPREEEFWQTDPRNPSTAGNGQFDEANLSGLGQKEFTWTYEEGDEVGVAVEGTSFLPTKYEDSSRMIFWAFSAGPENADKCVVQDRGVYNPPTDITADRLIEIRAGFLDFDQCAAYSTISPVGGGGSASGGQPSGLEVELSVSPKSPRNDGSGEGLGETVNAIASALGSSEGENSLEYEWTVKHILPQVSGGVSRKPIDKDWESARTICGPASTSCPFRTPEGKALKTKGLGLSKLSFRLNLCADPDNEDCTIRNLNEYFNPNGDGYLQLIVRARESGSETNATTVRAGTASAVLKMNTSGESKIWTYRPNVTSGFRLTTDTASEICDSQAVCEVVPNDILALVAPETLSARNNTQDLNNFQWSKDGAALDCDTSISPDECSDTESTHHMFLPVTDSPGTTFTVTVKASNIAGDSQTGTNAPTGRILELTKKFKVVEPTLRIFPGNVPCDTEDFSSQTGTVIFKRVGTIVNPAKNEENPEKYKGDYSRSILAASAGQPGTLRLCPSPPSLDPTNIIEAETRVTLDGTALTANPDRTYPFTIGAAGTVQSAQAEGVYRQEENIYQVLFQRFDIPKKMMTGQPMSSSAQIEAQAGPLLTLEQGSRFFASLLSRIPARILFLLRIFFSLLAVILVTGAVFAFLPGTGYDRRRG